MSQLAIDSMFGVVADPERPGGAIFVPKPNFAGYHRFVHNNADLWPFSNSAERGARFSILFDLEIGGNRGVPILHCKTSFSSHWAHSLQPGSVLMRPAPSSMA